MNFMPLFSKILLLNIYKHTWIFYYEVRYFNCLTVELTEGCIENVSVEITKRILIVVFV